MEKSSRSTGGRCRTPGLTLIIATLGLAAGVSPGCVALPIPHQRLHAFGIQSQVVSAVANQPVAGALIEVSDDYDAVVRSASSDAAGRFCIKPKRGWHAVYVFGVLPISLMPDFDIPTSEVRVLVSAAGFQTRQLTWGGADRSATEPGDLRPDGCYAPELIALEPVASVP